MGRFNLSSFLRPCRRAHASTQSHRFTSLALGANFHERRRFESYRAWMFGGTAVVSALLYHKYSEKSKANACGIVGYVGGDQSVDYLIEGLRILQNRGYDSAGICTVDKDRNELRLSKFASVGSTSDSIELLAGSTSIHSGNTTGIAHTRWATHGAKTDENAHPHVDAKDRIALVHNGTIENCLEIKKELQEYGINFKSQTDTEVIVQLIGYYMDQGLDAIEALKSALQRLEGSWGLAMVCRDTPGQIICTCNGSPLLIGVDPQCGRTFVASEHTAFSRYTNSIIPLQDREIVIIKEDTFDMDMNRIILTPKEDIDLSPDPYPHWTIKEIMDQPLAALRALGFGSRLHVDSSVRLGGLDTQKTALSNIQNLILSACGTSLYAARYGALLFRHLKSVDTVQVFDAAEVSFDSFPAPDHSGICVLSQSGETKDVIRVLEKADQLGIPKFSLVNCVGSYIARKTGCGVYLYAGREHAVASTKAFMNQIICLSLVATYFHQLHNTGQGEQRVHNLVDALLRMSAFVAMTLRTRDQCKAIAESIKDAKSCFVLGKGFAHPIAEEGALKIKEIAYIHAEGYSGGALKHGPFALIEDGTPVILIIPDDCNARQMVTAAHEVESRGAHTIIITDNPRLCEGLRADVIQIPSNDVLTALLAVVPLQMLAYELSIAKGLNPDKPRNLAKAVTVD